MSSEFQNLPPAAQEAVMRTMDAMEPAQIPEQIREALEGTQKGGVKNSIKNCLTVFQRDPLLRGAVSYNILSERVDIVKPLACRLFPLFLHFKKDGSPRVKLDVRAKAVCPLCDYGVIGLRTEFVAAAKTAYAALMEDDECAAFLRALDEAFSL